MVEKVTAEEVFRPGDNIMIEYVDRGGVIKNYKTRVEDLDSEFLLLQMPIVRRVPVRIREGIELTLWRKEDRKKQAYVTNVYVIENRPGKVSVLACSKPKKITVASRRRFFRCSVKMPLQYSIEKSAESGTVTDLSLSGLYALIDPDPQVKEGVFLNMAVEVPGESDLNLVGEVIRSHNLAGSKVLGIAVDFREITEGMQDILNRYLFQRQRELIMKGVLFNEEEDDDLEEDEITVEQ